ncbi:nucleotidyltransferase domain-containing protein [Venenivibrio stagnispumantis]|uniref:Predicted nucleotidyltransferase n=1 Tax=Venenivibrio stagnispumantis TaxID=407998 RepID=A0AA46AF89_9AQUI|nr:nucleotidyltransferase domain-containing protein [Venenivibrio stagnispumantis]MCW4573186.1 nucleotidyltransferase domain-containing protein [Venenivibrio stagnispumantis]SMP17744.1 Predicted nucleotidyltransferase [Venenivibrio stagnispumantis]
MNQDKVEKIINEIVEILKGYNPEKIILFGSRARKDFKSNSDIDIAVDLSLSFREERKLKEKIDEISKLYSVDLVFLPKINNDFKTNILKEGVILYEKK